MRRARVRLLVGGMAITVALASCGSGRHSGMHGADPAAVRVIRSWAGALRRGDVRGAARYFALPSKFANGADSGGAIPILTIHTLAEAEAINATLPCGAVLISAQQHQGYVAALFRLTNRVGVGAGCGRGVGQLALTYFAIAHGHIVQWLRAPMNGGSPTPGPVIPAKPSTTNPSV